MLALLSYSDEMTVPGHIGTLRLQYQTIRVFHRFGLPDRIMKSLHCSISGDDVLEKPAADMSGCGCYPCHVIFGLLSERLGNSITATLTLGLFRPLPTRDLLRALGTFRPVHRSLTPLGLLTVKAIRPSGGLYPHLSGLEFPIFLSASRF